MIFVVVPWLSRTRMGMSSPSRFIVLPTISVVWCVQIFAFLLFCFALTVQVIQWFYIWEKVGISVGSRLKVIGKFFTTIFMLGLLCWVKYELGALLEEESNSYWTLCFCFLLSFDTLSELIIAFTCSCVYVLDFARILLFWLVYSTRVGVMVVHMAVATPLMSALALVIASIVIAIGILFCLFTLAIFLCLLRFSDLESSWSFLLHTSNFLK